MRALGRQLLIEFYDCEALLDDCPQIQWLMEEVAKRCKATIVESVFHTFNPFGVSGVVVISESHVAIHTWPEYKYCAVDIFTCGDLIDPWDGFSFLKEHLKSKHHSVVEIKRGCLDIPNLKHKGDE
jgi:S-adenosylmethionine decarboxylase proenzyme